MIDYLFWDLDGTIFNTYPAINAAFQKAAAELGVNLPLEKIAALTSVNWSFCANTIADEYDLDIDQIHREYMKFYSEYGFEEQQPFPGVLELCRDYKKMGGRNFIVTHRGSVSTNGLLEYHQLLDLFEDSINPYLGYARKPNPEMIHVILQRYKLNPEIGLFIGDRDLDIDAAQAAGMRACGFGTNQFSSNAYCFVKDFSQLKNIIWLENHWPIN